VSLQGQTAANGRIDGLSKIYTASSDAYANSLAESMFYAEAGC
jgi:hypothetical protein